MISFLIGLAAGSVFLLAVLMVVAQRKERARVLALKIEKEKKDREGYVKSLEDITSELRQLQLENSISSRIRRAMEITAQQRKIDPRGGQEEMLLHNNLELEKLNILRSVLQDGHNPVITVRFNTGDQQMTLSSYISTIQRNLN